MNTSLRRERFRLIRSLSAVTLAAVVALTLATALILLFDRQQSFVARAAGEIVEFDAVNYSVNEADSTATITVTLSSDPGVDVTVDYATSDDTATAGSDYTAASGTLTFTTGFSLIQTFTVSISGDNTYETDETITLTLNNPTAGTVLGANNPATLTILDDEVMPSARFSAAAYSVDENVSPMTITVTLTHPSAFPIMVDYITLDGSAVAGSDYVTTTNTLTFTPGDTSETFTVSILDNASYEGDESLTLELRNPTGATLGAPNPATLTIVENELPPVLAFEAGAYTVNEADGSATITVTLTGATDLTATVGYATSNGTATAGIDYTTPTGTLTFTPTVTSQTFSVPILNDAIFEIDETVLLTLGSVTSATLGGTNPATLTLTPDGDAAPTVEFSAASYSVNEDAGPAVITVTLTGATDVTATVNYATSNGTALAGSDYLTSTDTLTFAPGATVLTFTVPITADTTYEPDETVNLTLGTPVSATLGATTSAGLTLVNDDPLPIVRYSPDPQLEFLVLEGGSSAPITVTLSNPSVFTVTVNYSTTNGTATAPGDYLSTSGTLTFTPSVITQTFSVTVNDNGFDGPDKTVNLNLGSAVNATIGGDNPETLRIIDDDGPPSIFLSAPTYSVNENAGPAVIQVNLSNVSNFTITVVVTTSDGTASRLTDYNKPVTSTVTIPGNQMLFGATFTIPITDDATYEGNETINLALGSPVNASLGSFNTTAVVTIVDNETEPTVRFSASSYSVNENGGSATITATLSGASAFTAQATVTSSNGVGVGRATVGSDYNVVNTTLTFNPNVITRTFTVAITNDTVFEGSEALTLTLGSPLTNTTLGAPNPATLTILDNETAPSIRLSASAYGLSENAGPAIITATLTGSTAVTATVVYSTANNTALAGSDYTAINSTLTFAPGVTSRTFTVALINDTAYEGNETFNLGLSAPVSATLGAPTTAVVTIFDDDPRPGCTIFNKTEVPPLAIPDKDMNGIDSSLVITGPGIVITDVSVRIEKISHTFTGDLRISLVAPGGQTVTLIGSPVNGGSNMDFIHTVLLDSAAMPISGVNPYTGDFHPDSPLSSLNGLTSGGTWRLHVVDNAAIDIGTLDAWGLEVCGSVTAPLYHLYVPFIVR